MDMVDESIVLLSFVLLWLCCAIIVVGFVCVMVYVCLCYGGYVCAIIVVCYVCVMDFVGFCYGGCCCSF